MPIFANRPVPVIQSTPQQVAPQGNSYEQELSANKARERRIVRGAAGAILPVGLNVGAGMALFGSTPPRSIFGQGNHQVIARQMGFKHSIPAEVRASDLGEGQAMALPRGAFEESTHEALGLRAPQDTIIRPSRAPTTEAVTAHELGHIQNARVLRKMGIEKPALTLRSGSANYVMSGLPAMAATAYAMGSDDPSWTPALAHTALSSPLLVGEGMANARALKHMVGKYGLKKGLSMSRQLAPAYGTYLALGATPLAATAGKKLYNRYKKGKETGAEGSMKTSSALGPDMVTKLHRLSKTSSVVRARALEKGAGIGSLLGRAASAYGNSLTTAPLKTLGYTALGALGTYGAAKAGQGAYHSYMAGADPTSHMITNGSIPTPPGVSQ